MVIRGIKEFRHTKHSHICINRFTILDTLSYADDLTLLASSEDELQRSHNLKLISEKCSMEISIDKTKIMAFCSKDPVPSKICINNQILERVNVFKYLGFYLSFLEDLDISEKITGYIKEMRTSYMNST